MKLTNDTERYWLAQDRLDIQSIRAVAVLSVVAYHASTETFINGYLGVDAFFVISSTLIIGKTVVILFQKQDRVSAKFFFMSFWTRRLAKLVPSMFVVVIVTMLLSLALADFRDFPRSFQQGYWSTLFLGNIFAPTILQDYFHPNPNPFMHFWSTSFEVQGYLVISTVAVFILWLKKNQLSVTLWQTILLLISIVSFAAFIDSSFDNPSMTGEDYFRTELRLWELLIPGMILSTLKTRKGVDFCKRVLLVSLFLIMFSPISLNRALTILLVVTIVTTFLWIADYKCPNRFDRFLGKVGDRSYSLFLVHLPILYFGKYSPILGSSGNREIQTLWSLALTFVFAEILFRKVETPFVSALKSRDSVVLKKFRMQLALIVGVLVISFGMTKIVWDSQELQVETVVQSENEDICPLRLRQEPCAFKNSDKPLKLHSEIVLLIGDSHADVLKYVVWENLLGSGRELFVWATPGCSFRISRIEQKDFCSETNSAIQRWISENRPLYTIVAFRSSSLIPSEFKDDRKEYLEAIAGAISRVRQSTKGSVIVVLPNPEFKSIPLWKVSNGNRIENLDPQSFKDNRYFLMRPIKGVNFIDSISIFCDDTECLSGAFKKSSPIRDLDHLTIEGSSAYDEYFSQLLTR